MAMRKCQPHDHAAQANFTTARMFASRWDAVQFVPSSQKHSLFSRRSKRMSSKSAHSVQCNQSADDEPPAGSCLTTSCHLEKHARDTTCLTR